MPISLNRDGDRALVEFDYSNATKNKSKKGEGFYYTFSINGGDKLHVNRHGFMAIDRNWCGKGGSMKINRVGVDAYEIEVVGGGENYPLELKQWNNNTRGFDNVEGWTQGMDPESMAPNGQPGIVVESHQSQPQPQQQTQQRAVQTPSGASWGDLSGAMGHSLMLATEIWESEGPGGVAGDVAGAIERMAVSLYIDARKMGLTAPNPVEKVAEAIDGEVESTGGGGGGAEFEDGDLPFGPSYH